MPQRALAAADVDAGELELLLLGVVDIDARDWRRHTVYSGGLDARSRTARWFWRAVEAMDQPTRARLLQFATGTSRLPAGGFGRLQGVDGDVRARSSRAVSGMRSSGPSPLPLGIRGAARLLRQLPLSRG